MDAALQQLADVIRAQVKADLMADAEFIAEVAAKAGGAETIKDGAFYAYDKAAELTTLSRWTLHRAVRSGKLAVVFQGARKVFRGADLRSYMDSCGDGRRRKSLVE